MLVGVLGYICVMCKILVWMLLFGFVFLVFVCLVKVGIFVNGIIKSILVGLKLECGIFYCLMKMGVVLEMGVGGWFEFYSSFILVNFSVLESLVVK